MKYQQLTEGPNGWTPWITPRRDYRLQCCHCGLVHEIEFMAVLKGGKKLDRRKGQIKFRLSQNAKATAAARRKRK